MRGSGYGALLDAVRGVRWPARLPVGSALPGVHHSRQRGSSSEFAEYRAYRQGDDPRRLDWRLLARTDRAYLRLATDRAVLGTVFLIDTSASMAFPEPSLGKWRFAVECTIGLAAVAHGEGDPVGLVAPLVNGTRMLPARTRRGVVGEIARTLDEITPGGSPSLSSQFAALTARRLVIVSDLLGESESLLDAARSAAARGVEVHVVHVVAREELEPASRAILATDPEDERVSRPLATETIATYRERFAQWRDDMRHDWRSAGAFYSLVVTDEPVPHVVRRVVDPRWSLP